MLNSIFPLFLLEVKLLYSKCMSVCWKQYGKNVNFSADFQDRQLKFCVKILCTNEHQVNNLLGPSFCRSGCSIIGCSATYEYCHPCSFHKYTLSPNKGREKVI